ncbi:antitoxin [Mycobacterium sp. DL440]|uniref:antitoxin n=1 Tax=Mycobacterium sp. DL440 TaxID=2675523 RepID=UPI00141DD2EE|nr:antitoxin [Mycobacterium sp. DL440]
MRTTIAIADELLAAAKRRARQRGQSLGSLVEDALRRELAAEQIRAPRPDIPVFTGGSGPRPGIDLRSNRALHETLDETIELNSLR